ncbi:MAG: tRNA(Ile)-lysidine synthase [Acidimicrobiales bacterium]|nr:MAG: tRNA(Ile)-lysidine synthase [Acidimicrobiales bacterium]
MSSGSDARQLVADLLERCHFPPAGTEVVCAFSGGADSTALVILATEAGLRVRAIHVDHGLRPESGNEARAAEDAARRLGVEFDVVRLELQPGPNLEARARSARRSVLPEGTLFGHTADDQAETVLLNLLRGCGIDGLGGMDPVTHPIIELRRHETRALCNQLGFSWVEDPMNRDPRFTRVRIRTEVLPLLASIAGRDPVPLLCRTASLARQASEYISRQADGIDPTDVDVLREVDEVVAQTALRRWLSGLHPGGYPPPKAAVARVMEVVRGVRKATEIPGGARVARSRGRLVAIPRGTNS